MKGWKAGGSRLRVVFRIAENNGVCSTTMDSADQWGAGIADGCGKVSQSATDVREDRAMKPGYSRCLFGLMMR